MGLDFFQIIVCIKKRIKLVLFITTFIVALIAWYSSYVLQPVYTSKSVILITSIAQNLESNKPKDDINSIIQSVPQFPSLTIDSYIAQANSEILMQRIIDKMGLGGKEYTTQSLNSQIFVMNPKNTNLLEVTVQNNSPDVAAMILNTFCDEFIALVTENSEDFINRSLLSMMEEVATLNQKRNLSTNEFEKKVLTEIISSMEQKIVNTKIARSIYAGNRKLVVFSPATVSKQPVGPNKAFYIIISFCLGLTISIFVVLLQETLTNYKKNKNYIREEVQESIHPSEEYAETVSTRKSEIENIKVVESSQLANSELAPKSIAKPLEQPTEVRVKEVSDQVIETKAEVSNSVEGTVDSPSAILIEGIRLAKHNQYAQAIRLLNRVIEAKPKTELLYLAITELSSIYQHLGLYPMAAAIIKVSEEYPELQSHPGISALKQRHRFIVTLENLLDRYHYGQIPYEQVPEVVRREAFEKSL